MIYKFLLTTLVTSLSSIGIFALTVTAQEPERPECYLIDNSGQLIDLTNICNASQKRSPDVATTNEGLNIINNNYNIVGSNPLATGFSIDDSAYILGEDNLADNSSFIDSLYYIDNEIARQS